MTLETMEPNPVWSGDAHEETVEILRRFGDVTYKVWGADWCGDCRAQLPDFAAALAAADVSEERIEHYPVDQDKQGEGVDQYGIEFIPTVVVERDGEELARFVEDEEAPIAISLAQELQAVESSS